METEARANQIFNPPFYVFVCYTNRSGSTPFLLRSTKDTSSFAADLVITSFLPCTNVIYSLLS